MTYNQYAGCHGYQYRRSPDLFQKTKGIPQNKVKYYAEWLDRFLQFYNGNLDGVSESDVKAFGDFLETNDCEGW
ncbi:MAG: hypothetical protein SWO11_08120 [Thermodesulfobacteriota bacterium]|nr:hypothetical protein [Thermodesulfobacteriota bacterium]